MKHKKESLNHWVFLFVAIFLFLVGCQKNIPEGNDESLNYRQKQALTKLTLPVSSNVPQYLSVGEGKVIVTYADISLEKTKIELYDVKSKTSKFVAEMDGIVKACRLFENGKVLLNDGIQFWTLDMKNFSKEKVKLPNTFGVFQNDMKEYFYVENYMLYRMNLKTGEQSIIKNEHNMRVASVDGIHPKKNLLSLTVYPSVYGMDVCSAIMDPKEGSFLAIGNKIQNPVYANEDFYCIFYGSEKESSGICMGSLSGEGTLKIVSFPELQIQDSPIVTFFEQSDYAIIQYSDDEKRRELWKFKEKVETSNLFYDGLHGMLENAVYLPEAELIMGCVYDGNAYVSVLLDPQQVNFEDEREIQTVEKLSLKDDLILKAYYNEKNWKRPKPLKEVQEQAERLEKQYGIDILIGSRCQKLIENKVHKTIIWENPKSIKKGLSDLEKALRLYPDDFFMQFQDAIGNNGIIFSFAGIMDNPTGYTEFDAGRSYIVMDISNCPGSSIYSTICHELWHATENFIVNKYPDIFAEEMWSKLNPKGFEYFRAYDVIYGKNVPHDCSKWILAYAKPNNAYFTDLYGCTFPEEDRARIMEWLLTGEGGKEDLRKNEHLNQKLKLMVDAVRKAFDTTGWDGVPWEEPLK